MKCIDCKKEMGEFEVQGMFPIYRNGAICVECSDKRIMFKPKTNPLVRLINHK